VWILPLLILTGWSSSLTIIGLGSCSGVTILGDVTGPVDAGGCRGTSGDQSDAGVAVCCDAPAGVAAGPVGATLSWAPACWAQACPHLRARMVQDGQRGILRPVGGSLSSTRGGSSLLAATWGLSDALRVFTAARFRATVPPPRRSGASLRRQTAQRSR
jgi:hypothetical protein